MKRIAWAAAYDGYAAGKYKVNAYYAVPPEIVGALSDHIEANGELQERHHDYIFCH